jgi:hypothetical protein
LRTFQYLFFFKLQLLLNWTVGAIIAPADIVYRLCVRAIYSYSRYDLPLSSSFPPNPLGSVTLGRLLIDTIHRRLMGRLPFNP